MEDCRVTLASLPSLLADTEKNLRVAEEAVIAASEDGSRLVLLPELMLTGHGAHPLMAKNAEPVPDGPMSRRILGLSKERDICICVGIAELRSGVAYNSMMVADRGDFLGCQSKMHPSGDEYCYFAPGDDVCIFDIGEMKFGINICYDSRFHELSLIHNLNGADAVLSAHAARTGVWPESPDGDFQIRTINKRQKGWENRYTGIAQDYNFFVLLCDAVGPSTEGLEGVVANHAGSVMALDPQGGVILRTAKQDFTAEIASVTLEAGRKDFNHAPTRNRRLDTMVRLLQRHL